jgi:peroxiredoxin
LNEGQKLRVGSLAEDFTLADSARVSRTLSAMLSDGPLLIIFYRGYW